MPVVMEFSRPDESMYMRYGRCLMRFDVQAASDASLHPVPGRVALCVCAGRRGEGGGADDCCGRVPGMGRDSHVCGRRGSTPVRLGPGSGKLQHSGWNFLITATAVIQRNITMPLVKTHALKVCFVGIVSSLCGAPSGCAAC